jgi:hypothetical protein
MVAPNEYAASMIVARLVFAIFTLHLWTILESCSKLALSLSEFNYISDRKVDIFPVFHVSIIHVLRQRMPIMTPRNPRNAVRHNIRSV